MCPTPEGGPYLAQEGDVFLVERIDGRTIYGRLANAYELLGRESDAAGSEDIAEHWPSPPRTRRPATDRRAHLPWTSLTVSSRAAR